MDKIGVSIKNASKVAYYDIKLGKRTADTEELQVNHQKTNIEALAKNFQHIGLDTLSSSYVHNYRLEGDTATSQCHLSRKSTGNIFKNMLLNIPIKNRTEFFNDVNESLNERIEFAKSLKMTFVGCSLLFAVPEYPIDDYGQDDKYEKPEIKFIDFAHPRSDPNGSFPLEALKEDKKLSSFKNKKSLHYEEQRQSLIKGLNNMKKHLNKSFEEVMKPHSELLLPRYITKPFDD